MIRPLLIPFMLICCGALGIESEWIQFLNQSVREFAIFYNAKVGETADYLQYLPLIAVYILGFCGVKGRHNLWEKTLILAIAALITTALVCSLKLLLDIQRPDGSTFNSFPSGHTATAFMGAEFLWQEYKERLRWCSALGYVGAASVGLLRICANRHWLTDIVAGAGFGMLSTKGAYLLYGLLRRRFTSVETNIR